MYYMYFFVFQLLFHFSQSSWTQQYGDPGSTSYITLESDDNVNRTGWKYAVPNTEAVFYQSPAVSDKGVTFIPVIVLPQYWLQVRAVSASGTEIWMANWIGSDSACSIVSLTNILYSSEHNLVIVGWNCWEAYYFEKAGQLVALNADDGKTVWRTEKLGLSDASFLSMSSSTIYFTSGYSCGRNSPTKAFKDQQQQNDSSLIAINLVNGQLAWNETFHQAGCQSQVKLTPLDGSNVMVLVSVNLPDGPYDAGTLLALKCSQGTGECTRAWSTSLHVSYDAKYAFSKGGSLVFGSYGFAGNPNLIFALETETGKTLFSNRGYCESGSYPSGPAADNNGHAYFSCGNTVFAVNSDGTLLWKSQKFDDAGYKFFSLVKHSPSLHIGKRLLFFIDAGKTGLHVLSMEDGSLQYSYNIAQFINSSICAEPPIVIGDSLNIIVQEHVSYFHLLSVPLHS